MKTWYIPGEYGWFTRVVYRKTMQDVLIEFYKDKKLVRDTWLLKSDFIKIAKELELLK